jgi:hypothetical protein
VIIPGKRKYTLMYSSDLSIKNKISGSHGGDLWDATQAIC